MGLGELVGVEGFLEEGPRACPTHAPALSSCLLQKSEGNEPPSLIPARAKLTFLEFCELCVDLGVVVASSSWAPSSSSLISKERPWGASRLPHLSLCVCVCVCPQHRCAWRPLGTFGPLLCVYSVFAQP